MLLLCELNSNSMKYLGLHIKIFTCIQVIFVTCWNKCNCSTFSNDCSLSGVNWSVIAVPHWDVNALDSHWSYPEDKRAIHDGVSNITVIIYHLKIWSIDSLYFIWVCWSASVTLKEKYRLRGCWEHTAGKNMLIKEWWNNSRMGKITY